VQDESKKSFPTRRFLLVLAGLCGLAGLLIEYGLYPGPVVYLVGQILSGTALGLFLIEQVLSWRRLGSFRLYTREHWPTFALSALLLLEALGLLLGRDSRWVLRALDLLDAGSLTRAYLIIVQAYLVSVFLAELPHLHQRFARYRLRPAAAFVLLFLALILVGTTLLALPRSTPANQPIGFLDCLFTSTSAVCVTGLIVRDTGAGFTVFGQSIILVMIQLGGLGIMSLTATLSFLLGRGIGVRESSLLREVFQVPMMGAVGRTVRFIIGMTLILEALGAVFLYRSLDGVIIDRGDRFFAALFHSVSAFCNAGFGIFNNSLVTVADNSLFMGTATGLLILGGLGFGVLAQCGAWLRGRALRKPSVRDRLTVHDLVVVKVSAGLLLAGCLLFAAFEWNHALAGQDTMLKISQALFQSATCRTAGFNSLDLNLLSPATLFLMILLMFIGGAPGSTAGGVKVTTLAIAWANIRSLAQGLPTVRLGRREIDPVVVQRAMLVLSGGLVVAAAAILLLLVLEEQPFLVTCFEVFSALGTVGLSLGMTAVLSSAGKVTIILLMFFGRLGPLTLASSLTGKSRQPQVRLPRGQIMVG
jgi:trk/ktr system potassium uptake protein